MSIQRLASAALAATAAVTLGAVTLAATPAGAAERSPGVQARSVQAHRSGNVRHLYISRHKATEGYQIHGMALTEADRPFMQNVADIPRLASEGINTVDLYITEYQNGQSASTIQSGADTPTRAQVRSVIRQAHAHGMAVEMMPIVWAPAPYVWRGDYQPSNVRKWFKAYTAMIRRWAKVAQSTHAELFAIGTEYQSLQSDVAQWRKVAQAVDAVYHGETTYMATAGSYANVKFWASVDDIGLSPYFSLSRRSVPPVDTLVKAWEHKVFPTLAAFSEQHHRRILLDEVGYESIKRAAYRPYSHHQGGQPSQRAQANAYQAAIDAMAGRSFLRGAVFFGWGPMADPASDTTYNPKDKLAECNVASSWSRAGKTPPPQCR
jgi:hypothetical protein